MNVVQPARSIKLTVDKPTTSDNICGVKMSKAEKRVLGKVLARARAAKKAKAQGKRKSK